MHSNNISENRELKGDKVENHDISLSHTFLWKKEEKKVFLFLLIKKNPFSSFIEIIRADNVL